MPPDKRVSNAPVDDGIDLGSALSSAVIALLITAFWAFSIFGPVPLLSVLGVITVMLPLWMLHDLGVGGLGHPENGFFVPTNVGYMLGAFIIWATWFLILVVLMRRRRGKGKA